MAPRSRSPANEAILNTPAAVSIADLPESVLAHTLGLLPDLRERQRAALVSKRFAAAACSPQLLREVDVKMRLSSMDSFSLWLARHASYLRRLKFAPSTKALGGERGPIGAALARCLPALGAAGQLQDLEVSDWDRTAGTGWLAAMHSLRRLSMHSWNPLPMPPALSGLTHLERLLLRAPDSLPPGTKLPPSVTWLEVVGSGATLPQQVTQLPNLQRLDLGASDMAGACFSAASLGALSALGGSLTRLRMEEAAVPPSLSTLTRLLHLELDEWQGGSAGIDSVLQSLTQLTCLVLRQDGMGPALPPALGSLPCLQHLCVEDTGYEASLELALPAGPMLRRLRWLAADITTLFNSVPALATAAALEFVAVLDDARIDVDWRSPRATAFFDWLAQHPPLRRLSFDARWDEADNFDWPQFVKQLMRLWRRRPLLAMDCPGFEDGYIRRPSLRTL